MIMVVVNVALYQLKIKDVILILKVFQRSAPRKKRGKNNQTYYKTEVKKVDTPL